MIVLYANPALSGHYVMNRFRVHSVFSGVFRQVPLRPFGKVVPHLSNNGRSKFRASAIPRLFGSRSKHAVVWRVTDGVVSAFNRKSWTIPGALCPKRECLKPKPFVANGNAVRDVVRIVLASPNHTHPSTMQSSASFPVSSEVRPIALGPLPLEASTRRCVPGVKRGGVNRHGCSAVAFTEPMHSRPFESIPLHHNQASITVTCPINQARHTGLQCNNIDG